MSSVALSSSSPVVPAAAERVSLRKLAWGAPLLLGAALVANSIIRAVALALDPGASQFNPLGGIIYIPFTIVGVAGAVIAFMLVARVARRPLTVYTRAAVVALLITFIPDVLILFAPADPAMGMGVADVFAVGALMAMHTVTAYLSVVLLKRFTRTASNA